jgi:hypothetical protein
MGIWNRLGNVVKNYLNDDYGKTQWRRSSGGGADPDLDAAYEELNDFLK